MILFQQARIRVAKTSYQGLDVNASFLNAEGAVQKEIKKITLGW